MGGREGREAALQLLQSSSLLLVHGDAEITAAELR